MSETYDLCDNCATAITDDNYRGLEFYSDALAARVRTFAASVGRLVISENASDANTSCDACHQEIEGHGHTAESL